MLKDERDLLEVLKFELAFLKDGGYGRSPKTPWRPQYIFQDSPTCVNYDCKEDRVPCSDCVLTQLVPPEFRDAKIPCRHIPFNAQGETLDTLYRYKDQNEIEAVVEIWLEVTIKHLEEQRKAIQQSTSKETPRAGEMLKGTPLYQRQHPKCANPACPTTFHWTGGGKFFRFRPDPLPDSAKSPAESSGGVHGVRHYWLCERCSQALTLVYCEEFGVVLKALWPELPIEETQHKASAACH
jgi:hypothetical protein